MPSAVISDLVPLFPSWVTLAFLSTSAKPTMPSNAAGAVPLSAISVFSSGVRLVLNWYSRSIKDSWSFFLRRHRSFLVRAEKRCV